MKQVQEVIRGWNSKLSGFPDNSNSPLSLSVFLEPLALVSTADWYVGKAADFTGSSYTTTPQGPKRSSTMNSAAAVCPSVNGVTVHGSLVLPNVNLLRPETVT